MLSLLAALPAAAHVTLDTAQAPPNTTLRGAFRVPHGCEGAATLRLTVTLPEGVREARPMPKPGWTLVLTPRAGAATPAGHGAPAAELASVTWEGGKLEDAHYDEFVIRFRTPDRPGETIWFPVVQDCEGGKQTAWDQVPEAGRRASDYPRIAAALRIAPRN